MEVRWRRWTCLGGGEPEHAAARVRRTTPKVMPPARRRLSLALLLSSLLASCCPGPGTSVGATVPAPPVNISVTQLRPHSAMVTWSLPQGDTVIGYAISQQRQDGLMQRFIREVNTSSHWCVLWDLDEDTHYSVQVQSVGLQADSLPSRTVQFRTLERTDHYPALDHHEPAMEGLDMTPQLQTGELLIITTVLLLWAAVIGLFCRQYDIIKDNDSTSGGRDKSKRPSVRASSVPYYNNNPSADSSPLYHNGSVHTGKLHRGSSSISIIRV